jgi:DNA invertase Pin-like site-specific DNA recombinase
MTRLAEMEREDGARIDRRTRQRRLGSRSAAGRKGGCKPKMTGHKLESAKNLLANGGPPKNAPKNLGLSVATLFRWLPASGQVPQLH